MVCKSRTVTQFDNMKTAPIIININNTKGSNLLLLHSPERIKRFEGVEFYRDAKRSDGGL